MFSFIEPIIELCKDETDFVIQAEMFFASRDTIGFEKIGSSQEGAKIEVPLDIAISLLRPDELQKLRNYITSYLAKRSNNEIK